MKNLFLLLSLILFIGIGCQEEELLNDRGQSNDNKERSTTGSPTLKSEILNLEKVKYWYQKTAANAVSTNKNIDILTSLNVTPMWELAYNWYYLDQYPMIIVPFEAESFLPNTEIQGAKLYIYRNEDSDFTSRILGYIGDSTYYNSSPVNLSVTDFTGLLYQIDETGRIGMVFKIENGIYDEYGSFPEGFGTTQNLKCPGCYNNWGNNSGFFASIGSFFANLWESVTNFFQKFANIFDFSNTGFNGYDPVGFGPSGTGGDPNNWDGFLIENGLKDDIFVYNYFDYQEAILNLLHILDCLINSGYPEEDVLSAVLTYHMGESDASAFITAFENNSNPNHEQFDFNDLQKFIYHFHDNHIDEGTGQSINPTLNLALDCDPGYVHNVITGSNNQTGGPSDTEVCAHEIKSILAENGIQIPRIQLFDLLNSAPPSCTDRTAMEEFILGEISEDWILNSNLDQSTKNDLLNLPIGSDEWVDVMDIEAYDPPWLKAWKKLTDTEKNLAKEYPLAALIIFISKERAENYTAQKFPGAPMHNDKADAYRHAVFNALSTKHVRTDIVEQFGDAHESEVRPEFILEKEMDLFNNSVGRVIGNQNAFKSNDFIADEVYTAITDGDLKYLSPIDYNDSCYVTCQEHPFGTHGITTVTQLIYTNM